MTNVDPRVSFALMRNGFYATCERDYHYFGDEDSGFYARTNQITRFNIERLLRDIAVRGEDKKLPTTNLQNHAHDALVQDFMRNGRTRLISFDNWKHPHPSKFLLAQAGYVYAGTGDNTYTHCCGETVSNWSPGMDPAEVHADRNKDCDFANRILSYRNKSLRHDPRAVWESVEEIPQGIEREYKMGKPYDTRHDSMKARMISFASWPYQGPVNPIKLAQAGFYYENKIDFVRCFYCNGGVMDWEADDNPFLRHAQMYSECLYIRAIKGEQFVQQSRSYPSTIPSYSQCDDFVPTELQCPYCVSRRMRVILGPCGHVGGCGNCAHQHGNCPVCRRKVMGRFQINF